MNTRRLLLLTLLFGVGVLVLSASNAKNSDFAQLAHPLLQNSDVP